jgi:hypothetical protein
MKVCDTDWAQMIDWSTDRAAPRANALAIRPRSTSPSRQPRRKKRAPEIAFTSSEFSVIANDNRSTEIKEISPCRDNEDKDARVRWYSATDLPNISPYTTSGEFKAHLFDETTEGVSAVRAVESFGREFICDAGAEMIVKTGFMDLWKRLWCPNLTDVKECRSFLNMMLCAARREWSHILPTLASTIGELLQVSLHAVAIHPSESLYRRIIGADLSLFQITLRLHSKPVGWCYVHAASVALLGELLEMYIDERAFGFDDDNMMAEVWIRLWWLVDRAGSALPGERFIDALVRKVADSIHFDKSVWRIIVRLAPISQFGIQGDLLLKPAPMWPLVAAAIDKRKSPSSAKSLLYTALLTERIIQLAEKWEFGDVGGKLLLTLFDYAKPVFFGLFDC